MEVAGVELRQQAARVPGTCKPVASHEAAGTARAAKATWAVQRRPREASPGPALRAHIECVVFGLISPASRRDQLLPHQRGSSPLGLPTWSRDLSWAVRHWGRDCSRVTTRPEPGQRQLLELDCKDWGGSRGG